MKNDILNKIDKYISNIPVDRKIHFEKLRSAIKKSLPHGFEENFQYGMIGYVVPLKIYKKGYHCNQDEPLPFLHIANQKNHISLYHMGLYMDDNLLKWFVTQYKNLNIGKLDMGKSCIRFKKMDKIPFQLIKELCLKVSVEAYISLYENNQKHNKQ